MIPILSCDPGTNYLGLALWVPVEGIRPVRYVLLRAILAPCADPREAALAANELAGEGAFTAIVEVPQIYTAGKSKGSGNDLVAVALYAGAVLGAGQPDSQGYRPREWKGNAPKDVTKRRALAELSKDELARVERPRSTSLAHNVWDAIGLGLHALSMRGLR